MKSLKIFTFILFIFFEVETNAQSDASFNFYYYTFEPNSDSLTTKGKELVIKAIAQFKKLADSCPDFSLDFHPYSCTDEIKKDEMISYKRANTILKLFIQYKIDPKRVLIRPYQTGYDPPTTCDCLYYKPSVVFSLRTFCSTP